MKSRLVSYEPSPLGKASSCALSTSRAAYVGQFEQPGTSQALVLQTDGA